MITKKEDWQPQLTLLRSEKSTKTYSQESFIQTYDDYIHEDNSEKLELYIRSLAKSFYNRGYHDGISKAKNE